LRGEEPDEGGALGIGHGGAPEMLAEPGIGGVAEKLAMRNLVMQDGRPCRLVDEGVRPGAGNGNQAARRVRPQGALLFQQGPQDLFLRGQRHVIAIGQHEEAPQIGEAVVVTVVIGLRLVAAGGDGSGEGVVGQQMVVRQPLFFRERRQSVEHRRLFGQRREVQHEDARIGRKAENGEADGMVRGDGGFVGRLDRESWRRGRPEHPAGYCQKHDQENRREALLHRIERRRRAAPRGVRRRY